MEIGEAFLVVRPVAGSDLAEAMARIEGAGAGVLLEYAEVELGAPALRPGEQCLTDAPTLVRGLVAEEYRKASDLGDSASAALLTLEESPDWP